MTYSTKIAALLAGFILSLGLTACGGLPYTQNPYYNNNGLLGLTNTMAQMGNTFSPQQGYIPTYNPSYAYNGGRYQQPGYLYPNGTVQYTPCMNTIVVQTRNGVSTRRIPCQ